MPISAPCPSTSWKPFPLSNRTGSRQFIKEKISSLANVVDIIGQHPEVTLFAELKQESIEQYGRDNAAGGLQPAKAIKQRAVLISFEYDIIQAARDTGWPQVGVVLRSWEDINSPQVTLIDGDYCFIDYQIIPDNADLSGLETKLVAYEVGEQQLAPSCWIAVWQWWSFY